MIAFKWRYVAFPLLIPVAMAAAVYVLNAISGRIDSDGDSDRHMRTRSVVEICHAAVLYWSEEHKRAPTTAEGLAVLAMKQAVPRDGYDRPLVYRHDDAGAPLQFALYSVGVNGIDENGGGDDVSNWQ
jgi:hypothetical protein